MPEITAEIDTGSNGLKYGLRQNWIEAEDDEVEANLDTGAGLGSPYLVLSVKDKATGKSIYEAVDVRTFLPAWIDAARERANANGS